MRSLRNIASFCIAATLPVAAYADREQTYFNTTVGAYLGYSNNPFSSTDDNSGAPYVGVDITPQLEVLSERDKFTLTGYAHLDQYLRRYSRNDSYRLSLDYVGQPTERISTNFHAEGATGVVGTYDRLAGVTSAITTTPTAPTGTGTGTSVPGIDPGSLLPLIPPTDIGLFGTRDRFRTLTVSGGFNAALTQRDQITGSVFANVSRYSLNRLSDYNGYGSTLGYSRQVSQHLNVGLQGSVSRYEYLYYGGDTKAYSAQVTASGQFSQYWTYNGAVGVSFIDANSAGSTRKASISGNLQVCRNGQLSVMCGYIARQVSPTGFGLTEYVTSAGLSWRYRLSERSNVSLGADFSKYDSQGSFALPQDQYLQLTAGYDRKITQRLNMVASARYRSLGGGVHRDPDYGGQLGVTYRLGDLR